MKFKFLRVCVERFCGAKLVESFNYLKTIGSILDLKPQDKTKFRVMFVLFRILKQVCVL